MASWNPARSVLLSRLLDDVVGTEEMVHIRQDYCRIFDSMRTTGTGLSHYHMGSKAEGLDLPGSDLDFMLDINKRHNMQVVQSEQDASAAINRNLFVMSTENVHPCFVMLRNIRSVRLAQDETLLNACQSIDYYHYLSGYLYVHNAEIDYRRYCFDIETTKTGPSIEVWFSGMDTSESGTDSVLSIHCSFWPDAAREWPSRSRGYGWPSPRYIKI